MEVKAHSENKVEQFISNSEFNRFGLICLILTIIGCLGGIAIGMGAIQNTFAMIIVTIPTMATLSLLLSVSPMRWIYTAAIIGFIIDVLVIAYYTLV